ncbi:RWD-domain-containing protein [Cucurbitaria berberidis CBS 394.84]|uniref:RWD-domain-containing protein n=1 Tax=Cucurbitaria berberidis CBS 394.84 TaxID=1168544 RepID=A0A9P4G8P7_9PLEO|nr:RWD-domain-containing protein [Cucurbitaria berberidis CBS 394.84]KAF1841153.1 RWD-domain-containing protein [Cucurbitaria berberidis CBS 394.84]
MGIEDQKEEREVLESIFPDEITDVSETEFRIAIQLDDGRHEDDESEEEQPTIVLNVQYPPNYPDEAPRLDVTQPPNAPKHPYLDIQEDKSRLLDSLTDTIEENLGMAMVFTLVTVLKDSAELLITERQNAKQALADLEAARIEEEENKKFQGQAVTRESFLAWSASFKKEIEEEAKRKEEEKELEDKKKRIAKEERKMTGRELWEKGLVGKYVDDEEEDEEEVDIEKLKISATS